MGGVYQHTSIPSSVCPVLLACIGESDVFFDKTADRPGGLSTGVRLADEERPWSP